MNKNSLLFVPPLTAEHFKDNAAQIYLMLHYKDERHPLIYGYTFCRSLDNAFNGSSASFRGSLRRSDSE